MKFAWRKGTIVEIAYKPIYVNCKSYEFEAKLRGTSSKQPTIGRARSEFDTRLYLGSLLSVTLKTNCHLRFGPRRPVGSLAVLPKVIVISLSTSVRTLLEN